MASEAGVHLTQRLGHRLGLLGPLAAVLLTSALAGCSAATGRSSTATTTAATSAAGRPSTDHRRSGTSPDAAALAALALITGPDAGIEPILNAIRSARRSVDLVMYELEDPEVQAALVADERRGVRVRVLLNGGYYGDRSDDNGPADTYLRARSVPVRWTPSFFALTHQKTLVVDGRAYIMTLNLTPRYYASDRDFAVVDSDPRDVAAIVRTFDADWRAIRITAAAGSDLVWSPGSEPAELSMIDSAHAELDVYNEEMDDANIEHALEADARRGVSVRVTMTYATEWKPAFDALTAAGVHVRTYADDAPLYIHAKTILTGARALIGSQNFSDASLQRNRELGIILSAPAIVRSLRRTFDRDFAAARPYIGSSS